MKRFASLLILGALSLSVSSAYGMTQVKEHAGVEIQELNVISDSDSVSDQTIVQNLDDSLETINSAQNIEGGSLVYQDSSVRLDDGNQPQLDNLPVGEAVQDKDREQVNVVDQQLDNRLIGGALQDTNLTQNVLDQQLDAPLIAERL
jgi:hypothetical protein